MPDPTVSPRRFRLRWWMPAPFLFVLLLVLFAGRDEGMDCCAQCGSYRYLRNWGFGAGSDDRVLLVVIPDQPVRPTKAMADFFPADHAHEWRLTHHRILGARMVMGSVVCGGLYRNAFANAYEENDALRTFVLGEIRSGRTSREEVLGMLHVSRSMPWKDTAEEKALRAKAWAWMKRHAPGAPDFNMGGSATLRDVIGDRADRAGDPPPK
jgi:hypothetical protein